MKFICRLINALILVLLATGMLAGAGADVSRDLATAPTIWINGMECSEGEILTVTVEAQQTEIEIAWQAENAGAYSVHIISDDGDTVVSVASVAETSLWLSCESLEPDTVYDVKVGAAESENSADYAWRETGFVLKRNPATGSETGISEAEGPHIWIDDVEADGVPVIVDVDGRTDDIEIRWRSEGEIKSYSIQITDGRGSTVVSMAEIHTTNVSFSPEDVEADMLYTVQIGAQSDEDDMAWSTAQLMILGMPMDAPTDEPPLELAEETAPEPMEEPTPEPAEEPAPEPMEEPTLELTEEPTPEPTEESTPEPTEEPTPEPTEEPTPEPMEESTPEPTDAPATEETKDVDAPRIWIDSRESNGDAMIVEADGGTAPIEIRWDAEGDVRSYSIQMVDERGNTLVSMADTDVTGITFAPGELEPDILYTIGIGAKPVDAEAEMAWSQASLRLKPSATPTPAPVFDGVSRLRGDKLSNQEINIGTGFVLGSDIPRREIVAVSFSASPEAAPESAWDASAEGDGAVLAWTENTARGKMLTIAGWGGMLAPENAEGLFANYTNMEAIQFNGCFDMSQTTVMRDMFRNCAKLKSVDLSILDTSRVTDMSGLFNGCTSLKFLDMSNVITDAVIDMNRMFNDCEALQYLDVSSFVTAMVGDFSSMFAHCDKLSQIGMGRGFALLGGQRAACADMFTDCPAQVMQRGEACPSEKWLAKATIKADMTKGDKGPTVQWIQQALSELGYLKGSVDGIFGKQTRKALIDFQSDKGLALSGTADLATLQALCKGISGLDK